VSWLGDAHRKRRDESVTMTTYGPNDALLRAFIVHSPAYSRQAPGQRRFADEDPRPELFEEFCLGHHTVTMLDEVGEHLERFGLDGHGLTRPQQFIPCIVEYIVAEDIVHTLNSSLVTDRPSRL
jgi:hypothetical protein